ncbi:MAG: hypothetical protein FJ027_20695 [Candidatus Rokubacteria bacterium]|nr:hypothetical protein [Candidatus Rokubacteria bacterium]
MTSWLLLTGAASLIAAALSGAALYQRCPHCGTLVRRARSRRWLRCRRCGRQYNRTVGRLTS